uniref:Ribosomal protein S3 n=1 Tax=Ophiocordyceps sobolifera TaxID=94213 RepID=UPI0030E4FE33
MKIFNNNLNNKPKTITLKWKETDTGKTKYLPSFSKEWKNIIYSYNKNNLKNIPINDVNINKIIQSYFNLDLKSRKYSIDIRKRKHLCASQASPVKHPSGIRRRLPIKKRNFLRRIYVSNAEIKHTNNKAVITLYTINREKKILKKKYFEINKKVSKRLMKRYFLLYKKFITQILKNFNKYKYKYAFISEKISKRKFLNYKLKQLIKFLKLKNIFLKKIWSTVLCKYSKRSLKLLKKYNYKYSINQYKFNKKMFLPILSKILNKIIGKKIEYNIINLKLITYNTDLFTKALALKLKRKKKTRYLRNMLRILYRAYIPKSNRIKERSRVVKNVDFFLEKYKDLTIISNLDESSNNNLDKLLDNSHDIEEIHKTIYNSISYKNLSGIRLEVKGRLTKRYRADRSIYSLRWKGGLKNEYSSFKGLRSVLFRGNSNSNVSYSIYSTKRRIGAYAVKGWIAGK